MVDLRIFLQGDGRRSCKRSLRIPTLFPRLIFPHQATSKESYPSEIF